MLPFKCGINQFELAKAQAFIQPLIQWPMCEVQRTNFAHKATIQMSEVVNTRKYRI